MNNALQFLEKAYIEETASRLRSEGYAVEQPEAGPDVGLDLIASKGGHKIAVQVKARPSLRDSAKEIGRTRDAARTQGFDEYRLVVVNPPHDREVTIDGLEHQLRQWIEEQPGTLASIASRVVVKEIVGLDLSHVGVDKGRIRVAGVGAVLVECEKLGADERSEETWTTDFPITFDVTLNHDLMINSVEKLEIDLSSLEG
jgi:Restriction endonuclease